MKLLFCWIFSQMFMILSVVAGSKKEARNDCCLVILAALEKGEITAPGNPKRAKATPVICHLT